MIDLYVLQVILVVVIFNLFEKSISTETLSCQYYVHLFKNFNAASTVGRPNMEQVHSDYQKISGLKGKYSINYHIFDGSVFFISQNGSSSRGVENFKETLSSAISLEPSQCFQGEHFNSDSQCWTQPFSDFESQNFHKVQNCSGFFKGIRNIKRSCDFSNGISISNKDDHLVSECQNVEIFMINSHFLYFIDDDFIKFLSHKVPILFFQKTVTSLRAMQNGRFNQAFFMLQNVTDTHYDLSLYYSNGYNVSHTMNDVSNIYNNDLNYKHFRIIRNAYDDAEKSHEMIFTFKFVNESLHNGIKSVSNKNDYHFNITVKLSSRTEGNSINGILPNGNNFFIQKSSITFNVHKRYIVKKMETHDNLNEISDASYFIDYYSFRQNPISIRRHMVIPGDLHISKELSINMNIFVHSQIPFISLGDLSYVVTNTRSYLISNPKIQVIRNCEFDSMDCNVSNITFDDNIECLGCNERVVIRLSNNEKVKDNEDDTEKTEKINVRKVDVILRDKINDATHPGISISYNDISDYQKHEITLRHYHVNVPNGEYFINVQFDIDLYDIHEMHIGSVRANSFYEAPLVIVNSIPLTIYPFPIIPIIFLIASVLFIGTVSTIGFASCITLKSGLGGISAGITLGKKAFDGIREVDNVILNGNKITLPNIFGKYVKTKDEKHFLVVDLSYKFVHKNIKLEKSQNRDFSQLLRSMRASKYSAYSHCKYCFKDQLDFYETQGRKFINDEVVQNYQCCKCSMPLMNYVTFSHDEMFCVICAVMNKYDHNNHGRCLLHLTSPTKSVGATYYLYKTNFSVSSASKKKKPSPSVDRLNEFTSREIWKLNSAMRFELLYLCRNIIGKELFIPHVDNTIYKHMIDTVKAMKKREKEIGPKMDLSFGESTLKIDLKSISEENKKKFFRNMKLLLNRCIVTLERHLQIIRVINLKKQNDLEKERVLETFKRNDVSINESLYEQESHEDEYSDEEQIIGHKRKQHPLEEVSKPKRIKFNDSFGDLTIDVGRYDDDIDDGIEDLCSSRDVTPNSDSYLDSFDLNDNQYGIVGFERYDDFELRYTDENGRYYGNDLGYDNSDDYYYYNDISFSSNNNYENISFAERKRLEKIERIDDSEVEDIIREVEKLQKDKEMESDDYLRIERVGEIKKEEEEESKDDGHTSFSDFAKTYI